MSLERIAAIAALGGIAAFFVFWIMACPMLYESGLMPRPLVVLALLGLCVSVLGSFAYVVITLGGSR